MADKKWPDWSEFLEKGHVEQDPIEKAAIESKNLPDGDVSQNGGEEVTKEELIKEAMDIVKQGQVTQATDEELFGHLVVTEEQLKKMEEDYQNKIDNFYKAAQTPVGDGDQVEEEEWANGKSFNEQMELTEEEKQARNMTVGE